MVKEISWSIWEKYKKFIHGPHLLVIICNTSGQSWFPKWIDCITRYLQVSVQFFLQHASLMRAFFFFKMMRDHHIFNMWQKSKFLHWSSFAGVFAFLCSDSLTCFLLNWCSFLLAFFNIIVLFSVTLVLFLHTFITYIVFLLCNSNVWGIVLKFWVNLLCTYSHRGFLSKYVKHLKDMKFLREDLVFSTHSEEVIFLFDCSFKRLSFLVCCVVYEKDIFLIRSFLGVPTSWMFFF